MRSQRLLALLLCFAVFASFLTLTSCDSSVINSVTNNDSSDITLSEVATGGQDTGGDISSDVTTECDAHTDDDSDGKCDACGISVLISFDFYAINDLHGKFADTDSNIGVDELTTYLKSTSKSDENPIFLSSGDMWQGSFESNATQGMILTDWMNELDFVSMTLGNHEYDWGEECIEANGDEAEFPFLAINIYERDTNERVDYCEPSVLIERGGMKIGIIGAIGDCYSSISSDKVGDVYFKTGSQLTSLVKAEADRLRAAGADYIVYSIHDGYDQSSSAPGKISSRQLSSYYDVSLSDGYVDLVFEGHTHKNYVLEDQHGVYHLQNGGDNKGISHAEIKINCVNGDTVLTEAEFVPTSRYSGLDGDPIVDTLMEKYAEIIEVGEEVLGNNAKYRSSNEILKLAATLYYEAGVERWGDEYDIVLGGGFMSARSPYNVSSGSVKYSTLSMILPFDNRIVLCSIKGSDLKSKFFETNNSRYYIDYGSYGASVKDNIDPNATYYIITDRYTSLYKYNNLTEIALYDEGVYARDLIADYIRGGGWQ